MHMPPYFTTRAIDDWCIFSEFKIWKISSQTCCTGRCWSFIMISAHSSYWMSSMLGVDPTNGVSQLTTSQVTRSDTLVHRIEALLPWDRPKVQWWAEIRSVNKHDLNLLVKDVMYFWWWFISIGPRVAPAAFMKCFHGVHTGLLENCWYSSSISITVLFQSLHVFTIIHSIYCAILFLFICCYFVLLFRSFVKRWNNNAYESPAQRFMPGEYVEGCPVLGLGFWAHFPVGWAWDLRLVALKQIGWNRTDGQKKQQPWGNSVEMTGS